jgi:hypothetical protein
MNGGISPSGMASGGGEEAKPAQTHARASAAGHPASAQSLRLSPFISVPPFPSSVLILFPPSPPFPPPGPTAEHFPHVWLEAVSRPPTRGRST